MPSGLAVTPCLEHLVPQLLGKLRRGVNLKSVLARIACPRDDRVGAINLSGRKVVILDRLKLSVGQFLQNADRVRPLNCDLAIFGTSVPQMRDAE